MSKQLLEELEFEKNKREILKHTQKVKNNETHMPLNREETKKYAWEYELENYRKSRIMDKFHTVGAISGIVALILTIWLNWDVLIQFLMKF
jgi:hypothetical protein